jgi:hypothetical protein
VPHLAPTSAAPSASQAGRSGRKFAGDLCRQDGTVQIGELPDILLAQVMQSHNLAGHVQNW